MMRLRDPLMKLASSLLLPRLWLPMSPGYPCYCGGCPGCSLCSGTRPAALEVEFSGITNSDCSDCIDFNTGGVPFILPCDPNDAVPCQWEHNLSPNTCFANTITAVLSDIAGNFFLEVAIGNNLVTYRADLGASAPNCAAWSGLDVPFLLHLAFACSSTLPTCTVTAMAA